MGSGSNIVGAFSADSTLSTPVAINKGGTSQTTAQAAIDALTDVSSASANEVLTKDGSGNATFQAASGSATITTQTITPTNGQTETATTFQDVANASITLPTRSGGVAFISAFATVLGSVSMNVAIGIYHNGSLQEIQQFKLPDASTEYGISVTAMQALDGSVVKMQWKGGTGTKTMVDVSNFYSSRLQTFEVS